MIERQWQWGALFELLVPIHRDGHKFVGVGIALTVLLWLLWPWLAWFTLLLTIWVAFFFRDPDRVTPLRDGLIVAPADGRIVAVERVQPPQELGFAELSRTRISIHLSAFDVHINRSPVAGRVVRSLYVPGAFYNPTLDKASVDNERRALVIGTAGGQELAVVQMALF